MLLPNSKNKRVAILGTRGVPARYGAFEQCAETVALGLIQRGWDVRIYCPNYQDYKGSTYQGINLEYTYHGQGVLGSVLYDILCIIKAARQDNDVVLMLGYAASPMFWIPRVLGKKIAVNTDGFEWKRSKWPWYVKMYLRQAERIVTRTANALISDSIAVQTYYKENYGVDSTFIAYGTDLPETTDTRRFGDWGITAGDYYSVVMRMEPENSIDAIVAGFSQSKSRRQLVIVGPSTPYFDTNVMPRVMSDSRIKYLGPIYEREVLFALRQNSCAYIHGHTVGGTNPSLLEAVASGNFVIARDVPFNREVVQDSGLYFDTADDLANQIKAFENRPQDEIAALAARAQGRVARDYTWDSVIDKYEALLSDLILP